VIISFLVLNQVSVPIFWILWQEWTLKDNTLVLDGALGLRSGHSLKLEKTINLEEGNEIDPGDVSHRNQIRNFKIIERHRNLRIDQAGNEYISNTIVWIRKNYHFYCNF
jgi:hypothetical protein